MSPTNIDPEFDVRSAFESMIYRLQDEICDGMTKVDGNEFQKDEWKRDGELGGGRSCVLQDGNVFEKAGVNVSVVRGVLSEKAAAAMRSQGRKIGDNEATFYACGLSLVIHPRNPMAPTVHLNYRYFQVRDNTTGKETWWFGGGADLTPSYLFEEDAIQFHTALKAACDKHDPTYYENFKRWCDKYFYIQHREEARGIGGIFFDDLNVRPALANPKLDDREALLKFSTDCLETFVPTYSAIMGRRKDMTFTPQQKDWQQLRRGRYVEFNLVYDRGTKFGLNTPQNARIESVLMSMPLTARWEYMHQVEEGSEESKLEKVLRSPISWIM